jgi:hypothetical protein
LSLAISSLCSNALQAGFISLNIVVTLFYDNHVQAVDSFPARIYYIDEPVEHNCCGAPTASRIYLPEELAAHREYIHKHPPKQNLQ